MNDKIIDMDNKGASALKGRYIVGFDTRQPAIYLYTKRTKKYQKLTLSPETKFTLFGFGSLNYIRTVTRHSNSKCIGLNLNGTDRFHRPDTFASFEIPLNDPMAQLTETTLAEIEPLFPTIDIAALIANMRQIAIFE
jgi:hypothetical protein